MVEPEKKKKKPKPDHETESIRVWIEDPENPRFENDENVASKTIFYKGFEFQMLGFNTVSKEINGKKVPIFYFKPDSEKGHVIYYVDRSEVDKLSEEPKRFVEKELKKLVESLKQLSIVMGFNFINLEDHLNVTLSEIPTLENLSKLKQKKKDLNTKKDNKKNKEGKK